MNRCKKKEYRVWRTAVIARDKTCVVCGKGPKYNNTHHLIPHEFQDYEYEIDNGITLCPRHHALGKFSAHKNPIWFIKFLSKKFPELYWIAIDRLGGIDEV
jgi:hypothetical protein